MGNFSFIRLSYRYYLVIYYKMCFVVHTSDKTTTQTQFSIDLTSSNVSEIIAWKSAFMRKQTRLSSKHCPKRNAVGAVLLNNRTSNLRIPDNLMYPFISAGTLSLNIFKHRLIPIPVCNRSNDDLFQN